MRAGMKGLMLINSCHSIAVERLHYLCKYINVSEKTEKRNIYIYICIYIYGIFILKIISKYLPVG